MIFPKTLLFLLLVFASKEQRLYGQTPIGGSDYLKNLEDALCIIRVDYVLFLKDPKDPQNFGRDGRDYFGRAAGLGFISEGRLWFDDRYTKPWQYFDQANYDRYKRDTMLEPRISQVAIRRLSEKKFMKLSNDFEGLESGQVSSLILPDSLTRPMMQSLPELRDSNGLLIIASLDKGFNLHDEDLNVTLSYTTAKRVNLELGKDYWSFPGSFSGAMLDIGGVWVTPKPYPQGKGLRGTYILNAAGIAKRAGLIWQVMPLPNRMASDTNSVPDVKTPGTSPEEKKKSGKSASGKSTPKGGKGNKTPVGVNQIEDRGKKNKGKKN